jgi:hypothetical protein
VIRRKGRNRSMKMAATLSPRRSVPAHGIWQICGSQRRGPRGDPKEKLRSPLGNQRTSRLVR